MMELDVISATNTNGPELTFMHRAENDWFEPSVTDSAPRTKDGFGVVD